METYSSSHCAIIGILQFLSLMLKRLVLTPLWLPWTVSFKEIHYSGSSRGCCEDVFRDVLDGALKDTQYSKPSRGCYDNIFKDKIFYSYY